MWILVPVGQRDGDSKVDIVLQETDLFSRQVGFQPGRADMMAKRPVRRGGRHVRATSPPGSYRKNQLTRWSGS